jgi:dethiobiotin synthetase
VTSEADRPARLVLVAGTGTDVGKTWVACELLRSARVAGWSVAARKPAQSYAPESGPTDAERLAEASDEDPEQVCPAHRWYERAMAPFMAAEALGRPPFTFEEVVAEVDVPNDVDLVVVESVGGVRSPISADGRDTVDLAVALRAHQVVLVADAGLGTINAVRASLAPLDGLPVTVVLNRYDGADELHRRNRVWLKGHVHVPVLTDVGSLFAALY